jgi:glycerate 2-kinase
MRILNAETLTRHGNVEGRRAVVEILETGMQAADPYHAVRQLIRVEEDRRTGSVRLVIGNRAFEPLGSPATGDEVYDLSGPGRVYVLGAGKGVQRMTKAIEDVLGDRLAGGHVIDKQGGEICLERVEVTLGAHPVPDENCVRGCERILEIARGLTEDDLVFTVGASGFSSLLTLPVPGVSLEDVRRTVYLMQIERGAPTGDLSPIRNHLDVMKGGQIAAHIHPARAIHLLAKPPDTYEGWIYHNTWVHTFPDCSTFADAVHNLKKWDAWEAVPRSVREHLERADPQYETVKPECYQQLSHRIFGVMPGEQGEWPAAKARAEQLGFRAVNLAMGLSVEASHAGQVVATIANTIERCPPQAGSPFEPPLALITAGEMLVTVGQETGIGGRNQEYALAAALKIAGSEQIVIGAVDTDGTDGPGAQYVEKAGHLPTLSGGVVDGFTVGEAEERGLDIRRALKQHNATPLLLGVDSGVLATQSTGLQDLGVILILGRV